jgi:hypothetical protein
MQRERCCGSRAMSLIATAIMSFVGSLLLAQRPAAGRDAERTSELEALVRRADFDAAETTAQKLLRTGALTRGEVARVYLQLGIVASAKRDSARATAAFRAALRLDGELRLAPSAGPHVAATFDRARTAAPDPTSEDPKIVLMAAPGTGELSVEAPSRRAGDDLARRVAVTIGETREARDLGLVPLQFSLELPKSVASCATATAAVLDEFGNELWPAVSSIEVCRARPPAPPPPIPGARRASAIAAPTTKAQAVDVLTGGSSPPPPKTISRPTWVAAAATSAAAVGTAVLGLVALERRDDYNSSFGGTATPDQQRQLRELAVTAERRATAGGIVTALLATATVVLYIRGRF